MRDLKLLLRIFRFDAGRLESRLQPADQGNPRLGSRLKAELQQSERTALGRFWRAAGAVVAVVAVFALGLPMGLAQESDQPGPMVWESIRSDFSNVRGLNYIASYAPSDVAMWRFYDRDQIDRELGYIHRLGANSVRVWLAWVVFDVEGERFIEKFSDFLSLCEKHRITVMPILWDSCFGDAKASYDDVKDWVANPGTERVADPAFRAQGDRYVRAVVEAGRGSPSLLMWDVMNEPSGAKVHAWLEHYCRLVKSLDAKHPVTIGWAHAGGNRASADWVDVMSYHPYGIFDKNRQVWTTTVRQIARQHGDKPILANEVGGPGFGQRYEECLAFFEKEGIGFYLFEAMVGTNRFRNAAGFVFPDGSARELEPVQAFQQCARRQGVNASAPFTVNPGKLPYLKAGAREVADLVLNWNAVELTPENYAPREALLRWTLISLAWAGALEGHLDEAKRLGAEAEAAGKAGDVEGLREASSQLAALAAKLLVEHGFVDADGRPLPATGAEADPTDP
jgi:hypothetical protein